MSQRTNDRMAELVKWRDFHTTDDMALENRVKFLERTIDNLLETFVDLLEDITDLEGRPRESLGRRIWTAGGMRLRGDLTRFG